MMKPSVAINTKYMFKYKWTKKLLLKLKLLKEYDDKICVVWTSTSAKYPNSFNIRTATGKINTEGKCEDMIVRDVYNG